MRERGTEWQYQREKRRTDRRKDTQTHRCTEIDGTPEGDTDTVPEGRGRQRDSVGML